MDNIGRIIFDYKEEWRRENACAEPGTFEWALIQMKAGKKVTRSGGRPVIWSIRDGAIFIDGTYALTVMNVDDALATNWQIHEG